MGKNHRVKRKGGSRLCAHTCPDRHDGEVLTPTTPRRELSSERERPFDPAPTKATWAKSNVQAASGDERTVTGLLHPSSRNAQTEPRQKLKLPQFSILTSLALSISLSCCALFALVAFAIQSNTNTIERSNTNTIDSRQQAYE